jgi:hypothetical protein
LLLLLAVTALASAFLGQRSDAVIIGVILLASVSLGQPVPLHAVKTLSNADGILRDHQGPLEPDEGLREVLLAR